MINNVSFNGVIQLVKKNGSSLTFDPKKNIVEVDAEKGRVTVQDNVNPNLKQYIEVPQSDAYKISSKIIDSIETNRPTTKFDLNV